MNKLTLGDWLILAVVAFIMAYELACFFPMH